MYLVEGNIEKPINAHYYPRHPWPFQGHGCSTKRVEPRSGVAPYGSPLSVLADLHGGQERKKKPTFTVGQFGGMWVSKECHVGWGLRRLVEDMKARLWARGTFLAPHDQETSSFVCLCTKLLKDSLARDTSSRVICLRGPPDSQQPSSRYLALALLLYIDTCSACWLWSMDALRYIHLCIGTPAF